MSTEQTAKKITLISGTVVSVGMQKSAVIQVERKVQHPLYKKIIRKSSKFIIHDEENSCSVGDLVTAKSCRPLSKRKTWILVSVDRSAVTSGRS